MGLGAGDRVGAYEILGTLGAGGMGEVYRARDARLGRDVAVKILPETLRQDAGRLRRFEQEARATGALNHPNVLAVYDVGEHEAAPFLVTELLEGQTLRERLDEGPVAWRKALDWGRQIAAGLAAAHDKGIVHRDLKPENLFITKDGRVKILDFGLAKEIGGDVSGDGATLTASEPGAVLGTAGYMAPEQVRGRPADARSDIFAFGAVLYELLSGKRAFDGETPVERGYAILNHEPAALGDAGVVMPPGVERVVRRCLEKAPDERFHSARDLGFALEAVAEGSSGTGHTAAQVGALTPRRRIRRLLATTLPVGLTGLVLGAVLMHAIGWHTRPAPAATSTSESPGPRAMKLRRLTHAPGGEWWPSLAPDGTWFVYVRKNGTQLDLHRQRVGGEQAQNLTADSPKDDNEPAISPDGDQIAFRSEREGGGIFVMGATGESVRRVTDFGYLPAWSPDGKTLAVSTGDVASIAHSVASDIVLVRVDTGARQPLTAVSPATAAQASWSPDGRWIAYHAVYEAGIRAIAIRPASGGEERRVFSDAPASGTPAWSSDSRFIYFTTNARGPTDVWRIGFDPATGVARGEAEPLPLAVSVATDKQIGDCAAAPRG